jgi:hypothetical protein
VDWISRDADAEVSSIEENDDPYTRLNAKTRIRTVLRMLCLPELLRTRALQSDLRLLIALDPLGPQAGIASVDDLNTGRRVGQDIRQRIWDKPHILVAYVWIMYSAFLRGTGYSYTSSQGRP